MKLMTSSAAATESAPVRHDYLVGVDIGGTKSHVAVADAATGKLVAERVFATLQAGLGDLHVALSATVATLLPPDGTIIGAGLGVAGAVDLQAGVLSLAPNLVGLDIARLSGELTSRWDAPLVIENDVNAAAVGEHTSGLARGVADFAFIAIGTGVGMGAFSDGRLIRGARGAFGEIGLLPLLASPYSPADRKPLEDSVSGSGIAASYERRANARLAPRDVFDQRHVDPHAEAVLNEFAKDLALSVTAIRAVLDPALVVLGGGIGSRPETRELVLPWLDQLDCADLPILTSQLGPAATVHGAIDLARDAVSRGLKQPERHPLTTPKGTAW